jgi:hypothetical protein
MKRKFKDGKYNYHLKRIKEKAVESGIITLRDFRKRLEIYYTAKGILIGGFVVGIIWLISIL